MQPSGQSEQSVADSTQLAQPKVSVVMTVYNGMPYLQAAVESILKQTYRDWEFIIVNDGSTDGSADYLATLDDPRVRVVRQENQGQHAAANHGISLAAGEYIARMDADDIADPKRLEKQVSFIESHPEVGLLGSQIYRMSGERKGLRSTLPCDHERIYHELIHNRHAMCNVTTLFRKSLFEQIGGYWEHNISEDWDAFLRMGEVAQLANLDEPLMQVRFHTNSINGRRMYDSQLHNEYACELARRRGRSQPTISLDEFCKQHRLKRWPFSWLFRVDCWSVAQYRIAVAEIYDRRFIRGSLRMLTAMASSPRRTLARTARILRHVVRARS